MMMLVILGLVGLRGSPHPQQQAGSATHIWAQNGEKQPSTGAAPRARWEHG